VELHCLTLRPEMRGKDLQFLFKEIEVVRRLVTVQRGDRVATAKPAERLAERNVEVKLQRRITLLHLAHQWGVVHTLSKMIGRRVAGVARPWTIVFLYQPQVLVRDLHENSSQSKWPYFAKPRVTKFSDQGSKS